MDIRGVQQTAHEALPTLHILNLVKEEIALPPAVVRPEAVVGVQDELAVLKTFSEPLLFAIPTDAPEYPEAKRLLKFLEYFLGLSCEDVPRNSLIREFIGGSIFED